MPTLRQAAELLAAAGTPSGRVALAATLGFHEATLTVDTDARLRLGLPACISDARIIRGSGALRALLVSAPPSTSLRILVTDVAAALNARTPHVLWLIIAAEPHGNDVGIACWQGGARGPRTVTLIAQRNRILASDAESLCALASTSEGDDLLVHTRWIELLGRDALSRRFYRTLEQRVRALGDSLVGVNASDRAELALLYVSRLLFLSFLEAKGWLDNDHAFLSRRFDACMSSGGGFHQRVLLPLFFGTLNTPIRRRAAVARSFGAVPFLNGGLFAKGPLEKRLGRERFNDAVFGALFGDLLGAYRFTAREGNEHSSDASIDPEMLGHAFECLMAARERRVSGAFYTPQALVAHVTDRALVVALSRGEVSEENVRDALSDKPLSAQVAGTLRDALRQFIVLDPACGSGAFLVHMLERLSDLHQAAGDIRSLAAIRREVLARAIHGVDVNPTAVWLCELRLWLSVVIESGETRVSAVPPLPNLDCNVRVGDTLSGDAFVEPPSLVGPSAVLARLRERYVRAVGPRKAPLRRALAREERRRALAAIDRELVALVAARRERLVTQHAEDLFGERRGPSASELADMRAQRLRAVALRRERKRISEGGALPFSFPSHFGAAHSREGFHLVIGNPPWVRLHNIPAATRVALRARFSVYHGAAWEPGARDSRPTRGFAAQVDLASLFVERSIDLASPDGCVALLLPVKLWRSLSGGGVRRLLTTRAQLHAIEDWSEAPASFDAAVYPSVVVASRRISPSVEIRAAVRRRTLDVSWRVTTATMRLDSDPASPWLFLPPDVRSAFDRVRSHGVPLGNGPLGHVVLGVKCGCNHAFMVEAVAETADIVSVEYRGRKGTIERDLLRPLLRGDTVTAWSIAPSHNAIVWTHDRDAPLRSLPAGAARWLGPWKRQLINRTDLRGSTKWWSLFRTEGATPSRARVVWSDFGKVPRAAVLPPGDPTVPLNSCYVVSCDDACDAYALTALLNGPLAAAWLNAIAEPARGGWHRYLAWTVSLLPLPSDWARARALLAPLAERAIRGSVPTNDELLAVSCLAYRLRVPDVAPLTAWCHSSTND